MGIKTLRIDVTASTEERKTGWLASAGACPCGCKDFSHKGSNAHSVRLRERCVYRSKGERHPQRQDPATCSLDTRTTGEATHTRERRTVSIVELTLILFRVRSLTLSRQHVQLLQIVMESWQIGYRETRRSRSNKLILRHSGLSDGDYEQSLMVQLFLDCVDRATASSTAFVSFRERPMHFKDNQTLNLRVVDPIENEGVWAIIDDCCNSCCHLEVWRQSAEAKMKVLGLQPIWLHRKATTFNGVGMSTTNGKLKIPMAIRLQESDMVECVHSHEILEKIHPLLVSQACQAKLGMTKRLRDGSVTLGDYDAQSLEVARQVETGLFMIRIDHLILISSSTLTMNQVLTARLEILTSQISPIVSYMRWSMFAVVRVRRMCFRLIRLSLAVELRILNSLAGRRIVVMNSGDHMTSSTRKRTTTSLFAV